MSQQSIPRSPRSPAPPCPTSVAEKALSQCGETETTGRGRSSPQPARTVSPAPSGAGGMDAAGLLAGLYKTKPCRTFLLSGTCAYNSRCLFAHGASELRSPAENHRDGLTSLAAVKAYQRRLALEAGRAPEGRPKPSKGGVEQRGPRGGGLGMRPKGPRPTPTLPRPPSFEEATRAMGMGVGVGVGVGMGMGRPRGCYRHDPYLPLLLHPADRLWSTPGPERTACFEGEPFAYEEGEGYDPSSFDGGYFPVEVYHDAGMAEGNMAPITPSEASETMEWYGKGKLATSSTIAPCCASMNLYDDELRNNTGMILEP